MTGTLFAIPSLLRRSRESLARARDLRVPGIAFAEFGRALSLREMRRDPLHAGRALRDYLNPVSCVRYFEFDFAARMLAAEGALQVGGPVLDISSPRLFPFWLAQEHGAKVTMINPDPPDVRRSRQLARHLTGSDSLDLHGEADATALAFADDTFAVVTSLSVIEHLSDDGDGPMMDEIVRVLRPGGYAVLTFPVKPAFENEFRGHAVYTTQPRDNEAGGYFFQRFYDRQSIDDRLLSNGAFDLVTREYYVEKTPGFFAAYEKDWMERGITVTVDDPHLMAENFQAVGDTHPTDRMGVCGLLLRRRETGDDA